MCWRWWQSSFFNPELSLNNRGVKLPFSENDRGLAKLYRKKLECGNDRDHTAVAVDCGSRKEKVLLLKMKPPKGP